MLHFLRSRFFTMKIY